jgi:coproporphyrinogen III oxidase
LKGVCDQYNKEFYSAFKKQADDYFFIPHRNETRGVGGIFFDHLNEENSSLTKTELFDFAIKLGDNFPEIYAEQVDFGKGKSYTEDNLKWRNLRRGRYVEFNLVNDRGTKFGLFSGGRTESILMSLPPLANWEYNFTPDTKSPEYKTIEMLKKSIDWVNG